jgi:NodT family efflux transporter outer membrane factor (OMF) lipoprotein
MILGEIGSQSRLVIILLIIGWLTVGCMVGPNYKPPPLATEATWLEGGDQRVSTQPAEYRTWWQAFKDPVLDRLVNTAYRQNLPLRQAGVRVLEARAQLGIARGELFPQQQAASGDLTFTRLSGRQAEAVFSPQQSYFKSELGGSVSWELDFWGKFRRAIESADASLLASIADYDSTLVSLSADVASAYINIRTIEKRLAIARQNVSIQKESLQIAEARFQGGTTSLRDVEQAKTVLGSTEATIPNLESQLRQAKNGLCVLLGLPPKHLTAELQGQAPEKIPSPPYTVAVGIPADLLRRRPDVKRAEYQAAAQCAQIGVARADLFPAFYLTGTFGFQSTNLGRSALGDMFQWPSRGMTGGPSFQWNILNYGRLKNNVRVQDARFQQLLLAYQNTVLRAQQEVEDSLVAFLKSQVQAAFLAESAAAAQRSVDLAIIQYREGITDFTTVLTAQQSLLTQQDNLAATMGNIALNLVGVYRALGGGWEIREGQPLVPPAIQEVMRERTNWGKLLQPVNLAAPMEGRVER